MSKLKNKAESKKQNQNTEKKGIASLKKRFGFLYSLIVTLGIALLLRTFVVQAYEIPSGSMKNTLLEGDFLLAAKFLYGFRVPYTDILIGGWIKPKRQKITIFRFPIDTSRDFVKRCIALSGDTIVIHNKRVFVNGKEFEEPYVRFADPIIRDKDFIKNMPSYTLVAGEIAFVIKPDVGDDLIIKVIKPRGLIVDQKDFLESCIAFQNQELKMNNNVIFVDGKQKTPKKMLTYKEIFKHKYWPLLRDNFGPYIVPRDHFFMLGDNRDDSLDSRFWGPVHRKYIFGEALIIYMSWLAPRFDPSYSVLDIYHRVRWNRLGVIIR